MEDFGNWIYIIAIVVAAASSLFKKKAPEEKIPQPETTPSAAPQKKESAKQVTPTEVSQRISPRNSYISSTSKTERNSPLPEEGGRFIPITAITEEEPSTMPSLDVEDMDEIKRGIIYSEILHRKYQ